VSSANGLTENMCPATKACVDSSTMGLSVSKGCRTFWTLA